MSMITRDFKTNFGVTRTRTCKLGIAGSCRGNDREWSPALRTSEPSIKGHQHFPFQFVTVIFSSKLELRELIIFSLFVTPDMA